MFCHNCGTKAHGKFCSNCGAKIISDGATAEAVNNLQSVPFIESDWENEIRYEMVIRHPRVRDFLSNQASQAKSKFTAEDYLAICDKAFKPIPNVPLSTVMKIAQPINSSLGVKTGKSLSRNFAKPPGAVLASVLGSLARNNQSVENVDQGEDGCVIQANMASDLFSFSGTLLVTIQRTGNVTSVEGVTVIKGQLYDWGKSKRILNALFDDVDRLTVS